MKTIERGQMMSIAGLTPHPSNYNAHPAEQIAMLQESLQAFGQIRDVVIWKELIVAGHGVIEAAKKEGWTEISATRLPDSWREERVLAYLAVDNESARVSMPDDAQLAVLLKAVSDEKLRELAAGGEARLRQLIGTGNDVFAGDHFDISGMELLPDERYDYVLLTFTRQSDFDQAVSTLGLERKRDPRSGWAQHVGLCRVVDGPSVIGRLRDESNHSQS